MWHQCEVFTVNGFETQLSHANVWL